jgi:hypothetical protein
MNWLDKLQHKGTKDMRIDLYLHNDEPDTPSVLKRLNSIDAKLGILSTDIKTELDGILAGVLSPEVQAKVDQIFAQATATSAKLDAATKPNP